MLDLRGFSDFDIPLINIWLNKEHVRKWHEIPHLGITIDDWMSEIKEHKGEFQWITYLVVSWQSRPIGLCLFYKCEDSRGEDFGTLPIKGSYGIDYLIGEESLLGKGLGKQIISLLLKRIFSLPDALRVTADIDKDNKASEKVLLSCGFTLLDTEQSRYVIHKKPTLED